VERIRAAVAEIEGGTVGHGAQWLAKRLAEYLEAAPRGQTLDAALDVAAAPFVEPWWRAEARARRDELLGDLAAALAHGVRSRTALAGRIAQMSKSYELNAWPHDRRRGG